MARISQVGVIGAGNMGSGIAQKLAQEGIDVVMVDTSEDFVATGMERIRNLLNQGIERRLFTPAQVEATLSRITGTSDLAAVSNADVVIEAIFEDKSVKEALFKRLDVICSKRAILGTNTSSFYVRDFARNRLRPSQFIGLHYFYHPARNRLLEVIPSEDTSRETIEAALFLAKRHGKTAILVKDAPGFAVNRFFVPFLNEAARMLEEGVAGIPTIEKAAKTTFRIGMGPFELMNVTGIPIAFHAATTLGKELGPFYAPCSRLKSQMEQGIDWDLSGVPDDGLLPEISRRFTGVCCGVAAALVDEGVASIEDTDRGAKIGLRWALGPFELMNRIGLGTALEAVRSVCDRYEDFSMPVMLEKQAAAGSPFQFKVVELLVHEGIGWITINRPEAMNALNEAVITQLDQVLSQALEDNQVQAIAIQGAGKAFVAGADIKFFIDRIKGGRVSEIVDFTRKGHGVLLKIETASKPTIAILDGLSLGGGSELALAAHYRIVTDAGSMGFPETGIGIYPGLGGMLRFSRFAGPELARYYTFTGARLTAQDLVDLGIATKRVSQEEIPGVVGELAYSELSPKYKKISLPERFQKLADACSKENVTRLLNGGILEADSSVSEALVKVTGYKAPLAMKMADEIIEAQEGKAIPEAIEIELGRLNEIFTTGDALEGLTSAGRKRPQFKGI